MKPTSDSLGILSLEPGEKLYHYTSIAGVKGICSKEFWATKSGYLNDRAEFQVAADVFSEIMHDCMRNDCALQHLIRKVMDNVEEWQGNKGWMNQGARAGCYVVSFSLEYDSALMWSEYSSFLGYCMCFDYKRLMSNFVGSSMPFDGKVVYKRSEQKKIMKRAIEQDYFSQDEYPSLNTWIDFDSLANDELNLFCRHIAGEICFLNMFFKQSCFSGENEYRIVFLCTHGDKNDARNDLQKQYFRERNESLIPFVRERLQSLDGLESVLVGPKNSSDLATRGLREFLLSKGINAKVERSEMPLRY